MKFRCQQADLLSALLTATRAAAARSTMTILECVHIEATDQGITLSCTDLAIGIEVSIPATVEEEGRLLLPSRLLLEVVRKLPDGEMALQSGDNLAATIRTHGSRTTLQGMSADEFPALPIIDDAQDILIDQSILRDMIRQTQFAVATDETRPILMGILIETEDTDIRLVALDGFRLALRHETLSTQAPTVSAVVPGKYMGEIAKMLGDESGEVALGFGKTHMVVEIGSARITVRLLDGEFIKYKSLLPTDQKLTALVTRSIFSDCVDRAALMAREGKNNLVRLHLEDETMVITSNSEMGDIHEELPIELNGAPLDIAFNVRYIGDALKNLSGEQVIMRFTSSVSPCILTPLEGDSYLYLLLPVRVYGA